jgi:hypothetical protein
MRLRSYWVKTVVVALLSNYDNNEVATWGGLIGISANPPLIDAAIAQVLEELKTAKPIPLRTAPPYPTQLGK